MGVIKPIYRNSVARELIFEVELNGMVTYVTPNINNLLGYKSKKIIGKNIDKILKSDEEKRSLFSLKDREGLEISLTTKSGDKLIMNTLVNHILDEDNNKIGICLSMIDVTEYKNIKSNDKELDRIMESSKDIIYRYEIIPKRRFTYISPALEVMLGQSIKENYEDADRLFEITHPDDHNILLKKINGMSDYSKPTETRWSNKDGEYIWFEDYSIPVYDDDGKFVGVEGICRNIQERKELEEKLNYLSYNDVLTGLYNRACFEREVARLNNEENRKVGFIVCDLDNLKTINDIYGHRQGDDTIRTTAYLLKKAVEDKYFVSRIGGDEFTILLESIDKKEVNSSVGKIKELVKNYNMNNKEVPVEISIGYSHSNSSLGNMENIFKEADDNMYLDKRQKKSEVLRERIEKMKDKSLYI